MSTRVLPFRVVSCRMILGIFLAVSLFAVCVPAALADAPVGGGSADASQDVLHGPSLTLSQDTVQGPSPDVVQDAAQDAAPDALQAPSQDVPVPAAADPTAVGPNRRYGVATAVAYQPWLPTLGAGWYLDFGTFSLDVSNVQYMPAVRIEQLKNGCTYLPQYKLRYGLTFDALSTLIERSPGAIWVIGNEPDRGPDGGSCDHGAQDDVQPEMYAQAYHDVYWFIKTHDSTARVTNAGVVQVTPGRLQYLDKVWNAYQALYHTNWPVDMWNIHLYILPEVYGAGPLAGQPNGISSVAVGTDPALGIKESGDDKTRCADSKVYCWAEHDDVNEFAKQIIAMRTWMKAHGQQAKPLILSEWSVLYPYKWPDGTCFKDEYGNCFTPERVRDWMNRSMDWMETAKDPALGYPRDENRLVQRWLWFSTYYDGAGAASSLLNLSNTLTMPGENYKARASAAALTHNLYPVSAIGTVYRQPDVPTRTASLTVAVRNAGSGDVTGNVTVTFYEDEARTKVIGSAVIATSVRGCDGNTGQATVNWPGLTVGKRDYWAVVDSGNSWAETDEGDNVIKGTVFVGSQWNYLPLLSR